MTLAIELVEAAPEQRPVLAALMELYQYDFTEFTGEDVGEDGRFGFGRLDAYFSDPTRCALLLRIDGHWAGLVLLHQTALFVEGPDGTDVAEFFVMRKYRRRGAAEAMARAAFARFPSRWQVRQIAANLPAQAFWRAIIGRYTGGQHEERAYDDERFRGIAQFFDNTEPGTAGPTT
jgi:predicted acetyltransferase